MAHTVCPNDHDMWNGDGKPVVWVYRINFFKEYVKKHPAVRLGLPDEEGFRMQIFDCVDEIPGEDLDCWHCDECNGLTVFDDVDRYDFNMIKELIAVSKEDVFDWEEYVALRDTQFDRFMDFYEGMDPLTAIETYDFEYKYRVSPDKRLIYAFTKDGKYAFGFERCQFMSFSPDFEVKFGNIKYKPFEYYEGKKILKVKEGLYAYLKNGKVVKITLTVEPFKSYKGIDMDDPEKAEVEVEHSEIDMLREVFRRY